MSVEEELLKRFVLKHHSELTGDLPVFILCFDEKGVVVPFEDVAAASPKTRTPGGLESVIPKPGIGYYAHMKRCTASVNQDRGSSSGWEVEGPDWSGVVDILEPPPPLPITALVRQSSNLGAAMPFLSPGR